MSDLISRQALCEYALNQKDKSVTPNDIMRFPSAQPDLCDGCDRYGASCVGEGCGKLEMSEVAKDTNVLINDCISRQAAIDKFDPLFESLAIDKIKALPSAQPEPRWIPVTERLPEPMGWDKSYLVSLAWGGVGAMEYKSTGFHNYGSFSPVPIETVTAWMPLPEPYKERREE